MELREVCGVIGWERPRTSHRSVQLDVVRHVEHLNRKPFRSCVTHVLAHCDVLVNLAVESEENVVCIVLNCVLVILR